MIKNFTRFLLMCVLIFQVNLVVADSLDNTIEENVLCNIAPIMTCAPVYFGCPGDDMSPENTGYATAVRGSADCTKTIDITYSDDTISTSACNELTVHRTWAASYENNSEPWLTSTCTQYIVLSDNEKPIFTSCPSDIVFDDVSCAISVDWTTPTVSDDCGVASLTSDYNSGHSFPIGTTTVTYVVLDNCGKSETCSFNVIVNGGCCTEPITINCPESWWGCAGTGSAPEITGFATAVSGDFCSVPLVTYIDENITTGPCNGEKKIERVWTAKDPNDNTRIATCVQFIELSDYDKPTINNCPIDINAVEGETVLWSEPEIFDNCGFTMDLSHPNGSTFPVGSTTVTYTVVDNCGNETTCSFQIHVEKLCDSKPIMTCPPNYSSCPTSSIHPNVTGHPSFSSTDPDCGTLIVTFIDEEVVMIDGCSVAKTIQRRWEAYYLQNPTELVSCVQKIELRDAQAPVITSCPQDLTVSSFGNGANVSWTLPTATDNCDNNPTLSSNIEPGDHFPLGSTNVQYQITDACGNVTSCSFNVFVKEACNSVPTINCPPVYRGCPTDSPHPDNTGWPTTSGADDVCGDVVLTYTDMYSEAYNDCENSRKIVRMWYANYANNPTQKNICIQVIELHDSQKPTLHNCPSDIKIVGSGSNVSWIPPAASDNCPGAVDIVSSHPNGSPFPEGCTTVIYTATDACGNSSTCSFEVCVEFCAQVPTINCPADYIGCPGGSRDPDITGSATASNGSASCGPATLTYNDQVITNYGGCSGSKKIKRTWKASYENNPSQFSTCEQILDYRDNQPPVMNSCPANISLTNGNTVATWTSPIVTDGCSTVNLTSSHASGTSFPAGCTTVTYTAKDQCGNSVTCTFSVCVDATCTEVPDISCPSDYYGCPGSSIDPSVTGSPSLLVAKPDCGAVTTSYEDITIQTYSNCSNARRIRRTWKASYAENSGSYATCIQIIDLKDTQSPSLTNCPSDILLIGGNTTATWTAPTASDNCNYTLSSSHQSGQSFPIGCTTVTYKAEDDCNNVKTCSFQVCVEEGGISNINLTCPDDYIVACTGSGTGATGDWPLPTFNVECNACDGGEIPGFVFMGKFNGHQYYCSIDKASWPSAQAKSASHGGYLAVINNAGENSFLASKLTTQSAYIGLSDKETEGTFNWVNGDLLDYTNWYPGQPNNYNNSQDYCELLSNGQWNDQYNNIVLEYIMEIPCASLIQTAGPARGSVMPLGTSTVEYTYSDACGNYGVCSFDVTVEPGLTIQCPQDITIACPNSDSGILVNWAEPMVNTCCSDCGVTGGIEIPGYMYMGSYGGSNYYCSEDKLLWEDAKAAASTIGGNLAVINDHAENAFLANILTIQSAYIGLSDHQNEGNFKWCDGRPLDYTNWYPGQPNNYNNSQDYVEMLSNGQWNDQYNSKPLEYIVEIPSCIDISQTQGPANGSYFSVGTTTIGYEAIDGCGYSDWCTFNVTVVKSGCSSGGLISDRGWIRHVEFGDISNSSGNNGGYKDFTNICGSIQAGYTYGLALTPGFPVDATSTVYWKVYIDFNDDGDYTDDKEYIATGTGSKTLKGNIKIPTNIWSVNTTMRVVMRKGAPPTGPCDVFTYGETEDYCIKINANDFTGPSSGKALNSSSEENILSYLLPIDEITEELSVIQVIDEENDEEVKATEDVQPIPGKVSGEKLAVNVYPNPASDIIYLQNMTTSKIIAIQIVDSQGRIVYNEQNKDFEYGDKSIDVSPLSTGFYIIRVKDESGQTAIKKLSVQRY